MILTIYEHRSLFFDCSIIQIIMAGYILPKQIILREFGVSENKQT